MTDKKEKSKETKIIKFFKDIYDLHGAPSYVLLRIEANDMVTLVGVSSNIPALNLVVDKQEKLKDDYIG